jgi:uncharacterized protein YjiS (DUF1127 family)
MREAASFIARQHGAFGEGLLAVAVETLRRVVRTWSNRRTVVSLADFDDHMLADIGLSRDDVRQALSLPFGEDPALMLQHLALRNRKRGWNA